MAEYVAPASKIFLCLLDPAAEQLRYMFYYDNHLADFRREMENLEASNDQVKIKVSEAENKALRIKQSVNKWMQDANKELMDAERLKEETDKPETCFFGWIPNCSRRYSLGRKLSDSKLSLNELVERSKLFERVGHPIPHTPRELSPIRHFVHSLASGVAFNAIMKALKSNEVNMVGLYGLGGVGKTTLVKEVVKKAQEEKLFDQVFMVVVSQNPSIRNIQFRIAEMLGFRLEEETEGGRADQLFSRLERELEGNKEENEQDSYEKKILIILDDVWERLDLGAIGIPDGDEHRGCKIIITTRIKRVCTSMECQEKVELCCLSTGKALDLFEACAKLDEMATPAKQWDELAEEISNECKGLPKAIVTVGNALRGRDIGEWRVTRDQLKSSRLYDNHEIYEEISKCFKLSYDFLKGERIKACFSFCAVFPEDHSISVEEMTRYGIGQGWLQEPATAENAREEIRKMFNDLKDCGLLIQSGSDVKMHHVVRHFVIGLKSTGENIEFLVKSGLGLTEWPRTKSLECCKVISLMHNQLKSLPTDLCCPKLEVLLLSCETDRGVGVPESFFKGMPLLKVLYLENAVLSIEQLGCLGGQLQVLLLKYCHLRMMSSIGMLRKLQVLYFNRSIHAEFLPDELGELNDMRLLEISDCSCLRFVLPIGVAPCLQKLESIVINESRTLEQVFGQEGQPTLSLVDTDQEKMEPISLPRLQELCINQAWSFNSFSPPGYCFLFPSLVDLQILDTQKKITTRFSFDSKILRAETRSKMKKFAWELEDWENWASTLQRIGEIRMRVGRFLTDIILSELAPKIPKTAIVVPLPTAPPTPPSSPPQSPYISAGKFLAAPCSPRTPSWSSSIADRPH